MIQRKILFWGLFAFGVILFVAGISSGSGSMSLLGIIIALPSIVLGLILLNFKSKTKNEEKEYKNKLKFIYRLIPQKALDAFHFYAGPTGAVKAASYEVEKKEKKYRSHPIKCNIKSNYTKEIVLNLIKDFYFASQSPERIHEYFLHSLDKFPCDKTTVQTFWTILDANVAEVNEQLDATFKNMWTIFTAQAERTEKKNMEILKNHEPTETTGLGFGVITNSVVDLAVYAAMDADERKFQELSNAPQLENTENQDSKTLSETYEKFVKLYQDFMLNTATLFSHEKLYLNSKK